MFDKVECVKKINQVGQEARGRTLKLVLAKKRPGKRMSVYCDSDPERDISGSRKRQDLLASREQCN